MGELKLSGTYACTPFWDQCDGCNKTTRCLDNCDWKRIGGRCNLRHIHPPGYCPVGEDWGGGRNCFEWDSNYRTCSLVNPRLNCPHVYGLADDTYDFTINFNTDFDDYA